MSINYSYGYSQTRFGTQERLQKWTKGTLNFTLYKVKTIQVVMTLTFTPVHSTLGNVGRRGTERMKLQINIVLAGEVGGRRKVLVLFV